MLKTERAKGDHRDLGRILALYERAFPENERRSLQPILDDNTGVGELLALYAGGDFCGFACLLNWQDISHIIYFAVEEQLRGCGYGAQALDSLYEMKRGCRMIADLEAVVPGTENEDQRRRRMDFYRRRGFEESSVRYAWRGEEYVILCRGGDITRQEFRAFWEGIEGINPEMAVY